MIRMTIGVMALLLVGCHANQATDQRTASPAGEMTSTPRSGVAVDDPERWALISKTLGRPGTFAREVYTITIPRDDLLVTTDSGDIPTAAGLETTIYFFKCPCGRTSVTGRFVVADYEANDVIDELQTDGVIKIASLGPILLREKPRLLAIQFQGEGDPEKLATVLKGALSYTAEQRMAPQKRPEN